MTKFPESYKFASWEFNMSGDRINWSRQTYGFLDWLRDLGGLTNALIFLFRALVKIISTYRFQVKLAQYFFSVKHASKDRIIESNEVTMSHGQVMGLLKDWKKFPSLDLLRYKLFNCIQKRKKKKS